MDTVSAKSELRPAALKKRLDSGEKLPIVDVREPDELQICQLKNTINIPMSQLSDRVDELNQYKDGPLVIMCRSGGRSNRCADLLVSRGFQSVINLDGGILAWSDEVDPTIQKY
jgi:adenylyltransferase/sulfurtransferase